MKSVDRRSFVKAISAAPLLLRGRSLAGSSSEAADPVLPPASEADQRFKLTLQRVLEGDSPRYTHDFLLADLKPTAERRFTEYSGDLSGRYIGALATAARVYGVEPPGLDALVEKSLALQKADGYFGAPFHFDNPTDADMALLWGNGRLLVGLLEYHRLKQSEPALAASRRIGDFLIRVSPLMLSKPIRDAFGAQHFASSYICWTQQTEGLALLYGATKDERYRQLAESIAAVIERRPGDHVHGYLTSLRGVMELHSLTRDPKLLAQCEEAWNEITASRDLLITGGVPEGWSPNNHRTEGCGEADWVRLNLQLWNATGHAEYLDSAERAIFNELAFNQFATGDFGHRVYTETGLPAAGAARAWWCCTLHGLRCFPDMAQSALRLDSDALRYDIPIDARVETEALSASAQSTLAQNGTVKIRIEKGSSDRQRIAVRQPAWADAVTLSLNGSAPVEPVRQGYISVRKTWTRGDIIVVKYHMKSRSESTDIPGRQSFWYGPWLLGASAEQNPGYFNELTAENRLIASARPVGERSADPSVFSVPIAAMDMTYTQAEYPDQPGTVHLRPIAEQTGLPTTSWEIRFLGEKRS